MNFHLKAYKNGFFGAKAVPDINIKDCDTRYVFSYAYLDVIFIEEVMEYLDLIKYEYNLKGVGYPEYYFGGNLEIGMEGELL